MIENNDVNTCTMRMYIKAINYHIIDAPALTSQFSNIFPKIVVDVHWVLWTATSLKTVVGVNTGMPLVKQPHGSQ